MKKIRLKYDPRINKYTRQELGPIIMADSSLDDMEKLGNYFENFKDEIRQKDINLYYFLLGVFDGKIENPELFTYFSQSNELGVYF